MFEYIDVPEAVRAAMAKMIWPHAEPDTIARQVHARQRPRRVTGSRAKAARSILLDQAADRYRWPGLYGETHHRLAEKHGFTDEQIIERALLHARFKR